MSTVRELHDRATELAQMALVARYEGKTSEARDLARQAYKFEMQAVELIPDDEASEPTRSILYLSAASLAYQCREYEIAQRLVAKGLSGYPLPRVEQDLKDLFEQINFEHHLQVRGAVLEDTDLQISMRGTAVGSGMVLYDEFSKIIQTAIDLTNRTVERKMGRKFRGGAGRPRGIYRQFIPALSAPRSGSFAITLRLGFDETKQPSLFLDAPQVIDEILTGIELINSANEEGFRRLISDDVVDAESYRRNFIGSVQSIAPDGEKINFLGFTSRNRTVGLTRLRDDIELAPAFEPDLVEVEVEPIEIVGMLDHAKSRSERNFIELNPEEEHPQQVIVEEGLIDVVRKYFGQIVRVRGFAILDDAGRRSIHLKEIWPVDE